MAVVGITEIKGNPKELLAKYDKVSATLQQGTRPPGLRVHTCVELPDGIRIANVWESEKELWDGFNSSQFQEAVRGAGMEPIRPSVYRVHNQIIAAQAQASV